MSIRLVDNVSKTPRLNLNSNTVKENKFLNLSFTNKENLDYDESGFNQPRLKESDFNISSNNINSNKSSFIKNDFDFISKYDKNTTSFIQDKKVNKENKDINGNKGSDNNLKGLRQLCDISPIQFKSNKVDDELDGGKAEVRCNDSTDLISKFESPQHIKKVDSKGK